MVTFQSTLPYGSDAVYAAVNNKLDKFQSTLPYGSDRCRRKLHRADKYFNPRSLTGATRAIYLFLLFIVISIHAPLRERLSMLYNGANISGISIHAPLRERQCGGGDIRTARQFQSTLPYGSDVNHGFHKVVSCYFNPRSLTGATSYSTSYILSAVFQSTLPYGSDQYR